DFPAPNISAEKRFTTTVPLQRLFLMNSDFMQIEAEELAKRVAAEPDNRARVRKTYQLVYGRDATESEVKLGLDYLRTEPLKEYEENKKKAGEAEAKKRKPAEGVTESKPAEGASESGEAKPGEPKLTSEAKPAPAPVEPTAESTGAVPETLPAEAFATPEG